MTGACPACARRRSRAARLDRALLGLYASQAVGWTAMLPVTLVTSLGHSTPFLVAISEWALTLAGAAGWAGMVAARRAA